MLPFAPKWKKEAKLLAKGATKFIHYKRDLLPPERVDEVESRRADLLDAVKAGDRVKSDEASKQLRAVCENALPNEKPLTWLEENVEVMFVAIVIALGLRAYYLQPFRIPTGSMMPTLNGIVGHKEAEADWPSMPQRMMEKVTKGRSYVKVVNDRDRRLSVDLYPDGRYHPKNHKDYQWMHFFSHSMLVFDDGEKLDFPGPANAVLEAGLYDVCKAAAANNGVIKKGTVLCEGYLDTGDLVLVDKVSYHFRKPKRGEVFVFDTFVIDREIRKFTPDVGSHYIKRLSGVPGDALSINSPDLLNHGKILQEPGFQRVAQHQGIYGKVIHNGYITVQNSRAPVRLGSPSDTLYLKDKGPVGMREYAACGDNTENSLDSRYWGPVKEHNLLGPALISLWPFDTQHWGLID